MTAVVGETPALPAPPLYSGVRTYPGPTAYGKPNAWLCTECDVSWPITYGTLATGDTCWCCGSAAHAQRVALHAGGTQPGAAWAAVCPPAEPSERPRGAAVRTTASTPTG